MIKPLKPKVDDWIEKGDHDLGSAKIIFQHIPEYFDTVAFHCQQAVEKYLKALLVLYSVEFPRTHDLPFLLELLSRKRKVETIQFDKSIVLNNFAIDIRYPEKIILLSKEELTEAIEIAQYFREFAIEIIQKESI